jgi:hypothetical protein
VVTAVRANPTTSTIIAATRDRFTTGELANIMHLLFVIDAILNGPISTLPVAFIAGSSPPHILLCLCVLMTVLVTALPSIPAYSIPVERSESVSRT